MRWERGQNSPALCVWWDQSSSSVQDSDSFSFNTTASQPDCQCDSRLLSTGLPHEPGWTSFPPSLRSGLGSAFLLPTPVCPAAFQWLPGIGKGWRRSPASWCQCHDSLWVSCWLEKGSQTPWTFPYPLTKCHPVVLDVWCASLGSKGHSQAELDSAVGPRCQVLRLAPKDSGRVLLFSCRYHSGERPPCREEPMP